MIPGTLRVDMIANENSLAASFLRVSSQQEPCSIWGLYWGRLILSNSHAPNKLGLPKGPPSPSGPTMGYVVFVSGIRIMVWRLGSIVSNEPPQRIPKRPNTVAGPCVPYMGVLCRRRLAPMFQMSFQRSWALQ